MKPAIVFSFLLLMCLSACRIEDRLRTIAFSLVFPTDGGSLAVSEPLLDWEGVGGAEAYHVQISSNPVFSGALVEDNSDIGYLQHSYQVSQSLAPGTYHWRVRVQLDGKWSDFGDAWSFTISASSGGYTFTIDDLISAHEKKLMNRGAEILDGVLRSYSAKLDDKLFLPAMGLMVDYISYPEKWDGAASFSDRIRATYGADDSICQIYGGTTGARASTARPRFAALCQKVIELYAEYCERQIEYLKGRLLERFEAEIELLEGANENLDAIESTLSLNHEELMSEAIETNASLKNGGAVIGDIAGYVADQTGYLTSLISSQLLQIQVGIEDFRSDMRSEFLAMHDSLSSVLLDLKNVKGELNNLDADILTLVGQNLASDINTAVNYLNSFFSEYRAYTSLENMRTFLDQYTVEYYSNWRNFYDAAKSLQAYVASKPDFPSTVFADDLTGLAGYRALIHRAGVTNVVEFDLPNPKKLLPTSLGNLEYLSRFFKTRFIMNRFLYDDTDLALKNSPSAKQYLLVVDEMKTATSEVIDAVTLEYRRLKAIFRNGFLDLYSDIASIGYERYDPLSKTWETFAVPDDATFEDAFSEYLYDVYADYLGIYSSELASLEVNLDAYLLDADLAARLALDPEWM